MIDLTYFDNASSLIYGIGNVGRQDDGLGWAFIDQLEAESLCPRSEIQKHYQLHLEDADLISRKQYVLFIDATKDPLVESFTLKRAEPKLDFSFTSHAISIPSIMATCKQCFGVTPEVYTLEIRGYEWELQIGLSQKAKQNLKQAIDELLMQDNIKSRKLNQSESFHEQ